jgi:hypothetical protein
LFHKLGDKKSFILDFPKYNIKLALVLKLEWDLMVLIVVWQILNTESQLIFRLILLSDNFDTQ